MKHVIPLLLFSSLAAAQGQDGEITGGAKSHIKPIDKFQVSEKGLQDWKDNTLGMFIHWGPSSHPEVAGYYKDKYIDTLAEWVPYQAKIPRAEYHKLAQSFNPYKFDADEIVSLAKETGFNYMVFTAKHHDGFAMFDSKASEFDIMNTPFKRDIVKELAEASQKQDLDFGVYYSHVIDWEHKDASSKRPNSWDFDQRNGDFQTYWYEKSLPQVKELAENYGQFGSFWFDMGEQHTQTNKEFSRLVNEMVQTVRSNQPDTVINSRIASVATEGATSWDIKTGNDNYAEPLNIKPYHWEMIATTNDNWGFSKRDFNTRSVGDMTRLLGSTVSRGGNLLLNIGIDGYGQVPSDVKALLSEVGEWMEINRESVIAAEATPFKRGFNWGVVTHKPENQTLYFHVQEFPNFGVLTLSDLLNDIESVQVLSDKETNISWIQHIKKNAVANVTTITLPAKYQEDIQHSPIVLAVKYKGELSLDNTTRQDRFSEVRLDTLNLTKYNHHKKQYQWTFEVTRPGTYAMSLFSSESMHHKAPTWDYAGMEAKVMVKGDKMNEKHQVELSLDQYLANSSQVPWLMVRSEMLPTLSFDQAGTYTITVEGIEFGVETAEKYSADIIPIDSIRVHPKHAY